MWALLTVLPALSGLPVLSGPPAQVEPGGPLRYWLHDPFLVWEPPDTSWLGVDGAPTRAPHLAEPLVERISLAEDAALLAVLPPEGRLTIAARSGELLVIDGPATVRLMAEGRQVQALVRDALAPDAVTGRGVRALEVPEAWCEGPWSTLDAARCPDFWPPWGRSRVQLSLREDQPDDRGAQADELDGLEPEPHDPPATREGEALPAATSWLAPLASGQPPLPTRARRPLAGPLSARWSEAMTRQGPVELVVTSEHDLTERERWRGLGGDHVTLLAPLSPGERYRVTLKSVAGRAESLAFEVLAEDETEAVRQAVSALEALTPRVGEAAVSVLVARLLETWGLDEEARERWWRLYLGHERHPQAPGMLARAFAAPP